MKGRDAFAYVVAVDGGKVTLNLRDAHRGQLASHREGISGVTDLGGLFAVDGGTRLIVLRVRSLSFAEPKEAHRFGVGSTSLDTEPLRNLEAVVAGIITRAGDTLSFGPDSLVSPALGADAYPLNEKELASILQISSADPVRILLGTDIRGGGLLSVGLSDLLGRHVAVLGATGQGKSCFTAAALQQVLKLPQPRIVLFDINGEYEQALLPHVQAGEALVTTLGGTAPTMMIPYYALGRHGLSRLLLPSEKTQRPALNFALEKLSAVEWVPAEAGCTLVGVKQALFFDDGRPGAAVEAAKGIAALRSGVAKSTSVWPPMSALACLVADSHCITLDRYGAPVRNAFEYSNVSPLITRIRRCVEDPQFTAVVDVAGGMPCTGGAVNWAMESQHLVTKIFGAVDAPWKIHIINMRHVAHDLLPMVLGSLLELFAFEMFRRGQGNTYPTLLVLEEAHHYLRQIPGTEDSPGTSLAYERLAKEGRKFGVGLWVSTQRPSEVSPTVLSQCGTWAVFRLTAESDLRAVGAATEWIDHQDLNRIAGLPRKQAVIFGSCIPVPTRVDAPLADPVPKSMDPDFGRWSAAVPPKVEEAGKPRVKRAAARAAK